MSKNKLRKLFSAILAATMIVPTMGAGAAEETGIVKNVLFYDSFESADTLSGYTFYRGYDATGDGLAPDDGSMTGTPGTDKVRHDIIPAPKGSGHSGNVLEILGNDDNFGTPSRFTHASKQMNIPISANYITVIEYEAASSIDITESEGVSAFGQASLSYFMPEAIPSGSILRSFIKYGTSRTDVYGIKQGFSIPTGNTMKKNEWHKVKAKLKLKNAGQDTVIVDASYGGRTIVYECSISDVAAKGLGGFSILYDSWNGDGTWSSYYVDNIEVYTLSETAPSQYVTTDGVIANDGMYLPGVNTNGTVRYMIPENIGNGWSGPWENSMGYRTYNFDGSGDENFLFLNGNGIVKRNFNNAINLKVPGIYEIEQKLIENTGISTVEMRTYFGSEKLYAGLIGNKQTDGIVFPQLKVGDTLLVGNESTGFLRNYLQLRVVVKNPMGIGNVYAKIWATTQNPPADWSLKLENVNLPSVLGTQYLNWAGAYNMLISDTQDPNSYLGTGYFADTQITKYPAKFERTSYRKTDKNGTVVSCIGDVTDSFLVDANFINSSSTKAEISAIIAVYNEKGSLADIMVGSALTVPANTQTSVPITQLGYDGTVKKFPDGFNSSSWNIKVFFWTMSANKPYGSVDNLSEP